MESFKRLRNILFATSAMALVAACASDSGSASLGGGGGGTSTTAVPQLGLTGTGGLTSATGLAPLTDPILGTDGALGGGSTGEIGGKLPTDQLSALSSQLEPVTTQIASALPLDMLSQVPSLGVDGSGGLVQDLSGQDALTPVVGTTGVVGDLLGGGNSGALGNVVPAGAIPGTGGTGGVPGLPSIPGASGLLSDPTATLSDAASTVTGLAGGLAGGSGDPVSTVTGVLNTATSTLQTATGGSSSPIAPVTGGLSTVTSALAGATGPSSPLAPVTDAVGTVTSTLGSGAAPLTGVLDTVTGALPK